MLTGKFATGSAGRVSAAQRGNSDILGALQSRSLLLLVSRARVGDGKLNSGRSRLLSPSLTARSLAIIHTITNTPGTPLSLSTPSLPLIHTCTRWSPETSSTGVQTSRERPNSQLKRYAKTSCSNPLPFPLFVVCPPPRRPTSSQLAADAQLRRRREEQQVEIRKQKVCHHRACYGHPATSRRMTRADVYSVRSLLPSDETFSRPRRMRDSTRMRTLSLAPRR